MYFYSILGQMSEHRQEANGPTAPEGGAPAFSTPAPPVTCSLLTGMEAAKWLFQEKDDTAVSRQTWV